MIRHMNEELWNGAVRVSAAMRGVRVMRVMSDESDAGAILLGAHVEQHRVQVTSVHGRVKAVEGGIATDPGWADSRIQ